MQLDAWQKRVYCVETEWTPAWTVQRACFTFPQLRNDLPEKAGQRVTDVSRQLSVSLGVLLL